MKQLFQISTTTPAEPGQQVLAFRIGEKHCSFAITDLSGTKLYQLAYYSADRMDEGSLMNLFVAHPELNNSFHKVLVSYDYPQAVLTPLQHYKYEDAQLLLKTMHGVNGKTAIASEPIVEWQIYNVYAVPEKVYEWLNKKFPVGKYWHNYTLAVKNITGTDTAGGLWIDFRKDDFTLIAAKENKLLLAQTFLYSTPVDVIYYLLKICQQFSLSQQEVKLAVSGLIDKESALYKELYQYFLNTEFNDANWNISGNTEYPAHFFKSLNDLSQCAS
ncbi:MAG: DUF3822 family protein [Chitinophagales bacterium]